MLAIILSFHKFHHRTALPCLGIALLLLTAGCSKNERAIEQTLFTNVELQAITIDPMLLRIMADETLLTDSLVTPDGVKKIPVKYTDPAHRLQVTDQFTNRLLADTVVNYQPGEKNTITFFQPAAGARLVWVGPPVNEPAPPAGKKKISIVYTLPNQVMPNEVKVIVDNSKSGTSALDYRPTDSFLLKKGEFSSWFWCWNDRKPQLRIIKNNARRDTVALVNPTEFAAAISDYSIFYFKDVSAGFATLSKLY